MTGPSHTTAGRPSPVRSLVRRAVFAVALMSLWMHGCASVPEATEADPGVLSEIATPPVYRLGTGDRIRVTVFGHDDLSGEFEVDGVGTVSLPLIQVVEAAGRTTVEMAGIIADRLEPDYLKDPKVSVDIVAYRPVFILGEVRNPGSYEYVNGMTVVTAVALAGGYSYRAAKNKITVIRGDDPEKRKTPATEGTRILPGDTIEVPERFF